jgi:hypothetical protein
MTCNLRNPWIPWKCSHFPQLTCEKCDFDICSGCAELMSLAVEKREEIQRKEGEKHEAFKTLKLKREREIYEDVSNAKDIIRKPGPRNRDKKTMLNFVVWSSIGYEEDDGSQSYFGPPQKEFDSSYPTQADANARVKYLFYLENMWGSPIEEMIRRYMSDIHHTLSMEEIENRDAESTTNGLLTLEINPDGPERWTVSAIPSSDFASLVENTTQEREKYEERQRKEQQEWQTNRPTEIISQQSLHTIVKPALHSCPLAPTDSLRMMGQHRDHRKITFCNLRTPSKCTHFPQLTCEKCDFNICLACAEWMSLPVEKREEIQRKEEESVRLSGH